MLRSVINSLEGGVCILSANGTILDTNDQWDSEVADSDGGHGRLGGDFFAYCSAAPAGLGAMGADVATTVREVLRGGGGSRSVKCQVMRDGEPRWIVVRVHPIERNDQARAMVNAIDITAGMRTQEALRRTTERAEHLASELTAEKELLGTVLAAIPHLVYWKDAGLRYVGCNQAYLLPRAGAGAEVVGRVESALGGGDPLSSCSPDLRAAG